MAVTVAKVAELASTSNVNDYAVPAYTPTANTIQVALVCMTGSDGSSVGTFDDSEGAWTKKTHVFAQTVRGFYVFWRKVTGSPVSITPTFHSPSDVGSGCGILIWECDPDTMPSGDPIRQAINTFGAPSGPYTDFTFTFSSALLTGNGYAVLIRTDNNPVTGAVPSGWTEDLDTGFASPTTGIWAGHRAGGETGTSYITTGTSTSSYEAIAVEIWNEEPPTDVYSGRGVGRGISRGVMR